MQEDLQFGYHGNPDDTGTITPLMEHDASSYLKSREACVRCRVRKVKCTGTQPCRNCSVSQLPCVFENRPRRPRRISVMDTQIEALQSRIRELEEIVSVEKTSSPLAYFETENSQIKEKNKMNLSLFLGSGSSELLCYNLIHWCIDDDLKENTSEVDVMPNFTSLVEEDDYDSIMFAKGMSSTECDINNHLMSLTLKEMEELLQLMLDNVDYGFLTFDPSKFMKDVIRYCTGSNGYLRLPSARVDYQYFGCKMLMVTALGLIFAYKLNGTSLAKSEIPGLTPYKLVMSYLPLAIQILTISHHNPSETFEVIELLGLVALYMRCYDKKNRSAMVTLNALELCIALNLHKKSLYPNRLNKEGFDHLQLFWSTYSLNRFLSCRIGQPILLHEQEIETEIPISTSSSTKFNIELAKIAERIVHEVYTLRSAMDTKNYLKSILSTLEELTEMSQKFTDIDELTQKVLSTTEPGSPNFTSPSQKLVLGIHLNYYHHIHLVSVPIVLHLARFSILAFRHPLKFQNSNILIKTLPNGVQKALRAFAISTSKSVQILLILRRKRLLNIFDITELDYICSSTVSLIICLILQLDEELNSTGNFEAQRLSRKLEVMLDMLIEIRLHGNLIAKGKFKQILKLLSSLKVLFQSRGQSPFIDILNRFALIEFQLDFSLGMNNNTSEERAITHDINQSISNGYDEIIGQLPSQRAQDFSTEPRARYTFSPLNFQYNEEDVNLLNELFDDLDAIIVE